MENKEIIHTLILLNRWELVLLNQISRGEDSSTKLARSLHEPAKTIQKDFGRLIHLGLIYARPKLGVRLTERGRSLLENIGHLSENKGAINHD